MISTRVALHRAAFAVLVVILAAVAFGASVARSASGNAVIVKAPNGRAGGSTAAKQGADQGEDQGENVGQNASGTGLFGSVMVRARNSIRSGDGRGGDGGDATVTFENHVYVTCNGGQGSLLVPVEQVSVTAGAGGNGGISGRGQGSDQGEDQGENIGQSASAGTAITQTSVGASNFIGSGDVRGGRGGGVHIAYDNETSCGAPASLPGDSQTPTTTDSAGNTSVTFVRSASCGSTLSNTPFVITAGRGGSGGRTGTGQGSDQGEDQGENIGQFASGAARMGATNINAVNSLSSNDVSGSDGASVSVTFENYIDLTCATSAGSAAQTPTAPVAAIAGNGGRGGETGEGQGADQGEDQGENVGQFSTALVGIAPVSITAVNSIVSGAANGGPGGKVSITYSDSTACASSANPIATVDERVAANAGTGGAGGSSGASQGSDQGEDQGENIAQSASGPGRLGSVLVRARNSNTSGAAIGGAGGAVSVTYAPAVCASGLSPAATIDERVAANAGNGGRGGATGTAQGADQGEDQGENIAQLLRGMSGTGQTTVMAINRNLARAAGGGGGGGVIVTYTPAECQSTFNPLALPNLQVEAVVGSGGASGKSGSGQGSDQGEDQGENIRQLASGRSGAGRTTIRAEGKNTSGHADAGNNGTAVINGCGAMPAPTVPVQPRSGLSAVPRRAHIAHTGGSVDPDIRICRGTFSGRTIDVIVPGGQVCRLTSSARVSHNVEVRPGGALSDQGANIGHDLFAYQAVGIHVRGGSIGHNVMIDFLRGANLSGGNAICGASAHHDLLVEQSDPTAGVTVIGGGANCRGNRVGHDLIVAGNQGGASVSNNTAAHDTTCHANRPLHGRGNRAAHLNSCLG